MYQQQRKDDLDRQAQEMALRNAMQRLNERQFSEEQNQNTVRNKQFDTQQTFREKEFTANEEERKYRHQRDMTDDATGVLKTLIPQGYSGQQAYPLTDALKRGDIGSFNEAVKGLTASPLLAEKNKQQWARLENSLQGEELRFFRMTRDSIFNAGRATWDEACQEALIQLHAMRAHSRINAGGGETPAPAPQLPAEGQQTPSVMLPQGQPAGEFSPFIDFTQGGGPGRDFGVNERVNSQIQSRRAFTDKTRQTIEQNAEIQPFKVANARLAGELAKQRKAESEARVNRMKTLLPYEQMMKAQGVKNLITREEIQKFDLEQKQQEAEWRKRTGGGTEGQLRIQQQAETRAQGIFQKEMQLKKESAAIDKSLAAYRVVAKSPPPVQNDPQYGQKMQQIQMANELLPGLEARKSQIGEDLKVLDGMRKNNNRWRNIRITPTTESGKPLLPGTENYGRYYQSDAGQKELREARANKKPPAVAAPPKAGTKGFAPVTPPPGVKTPAGKKPAGKPDFSKMTDAQLKAWRPGR